MAVNDSFLIHSQSSDNIKKSNDIINHATDQVQANCNCDLSAKHVAMERLMCGDASTDRVIFTGTLIGTDTTPSDQIREQLQLWVKNEQIILVQGVHLKIIACVVRLEENEKPRCVPLYTPPPLTEAVGQESEPDSIGFPLYIGVAGGVLLLLICVTVTIIIIIVIVRKRQRKVYRTTTERCDTTRTLIRFCHGRAKLMVLIGVCLTMH